jgi:SAM-dependent methyltransferase
VGGGPGEHAAAWAVAGINAVVVDPSAAMLAAAKRHQGVATVRGVSQQLPFRAGTFRLVFFHLSLHYGDWRRALDEATRVLAPGGSCWVWTLGPDHHATSMLSRWFPSIAELDRARFPDPDDVAAHLAGRGSIERGKVREQKQRPSGEWREAVAAGFVSTLQLLEPDELDAGLRRFAEQYPDPQAPVTYEMRWDWIHLRRLP